MSKKLKYILQDIGREMTLSDRMRIVKPVDMDEKIWQLVITLNLKGIVTAGSCDGHYLTPGATQLFPWVSLEPDWALRSQHEVMRLKEALANYNLRHPVQWDVVPHSPDETNFYGFVHPTTVTDLRILQASIPSVTEHLEINL